MELHTLAVHIDTIDSLQYATLYNIASLCPLEGGRAVFHARALLNRLLNTSLIWNDSCTININDTNNHRPRKFIIVHYMSPAYYANAQVYPNPANTELNIELSLQQGKTANVCLYNSLGQVVICESLQNGLNELTINKLTNGIYYYRIIDNNGDLLKADKQMIIH